MDEIKKGVIETQSVPDNVERLVKLDIKNGKASATLFANPNGSKIKQRLEALETRFNNLKTINKEELYGPGDIEINTGSSTVDDVTKAYVDERDSQILSSAKQYTDEALSAARDYADEAAKSSLATAKDYADKLVAGLDPSQPSQPSGENNEVVFIDASSNPSEAYTKALEAYNKGKAIIVKCDANSMIPMTTVENDEDVVFRGFNMSYTGYNINRNITVSTVMWELSSDGLNNKVRDVPAYSCRTVDCTKGSYVNAFNNALNEYNNGYSIILKVDANTSVLATSINTTSMAGYTFSFNTGTLEDGRTGIVSVDIIRWRFTSSGLSKDTFNTGSITGGDGGGGEVTLTQYYSTNDIDDGIPQNPDDYPTFWNQSEQTSATIWAAMKATGGSWVIWKVQPKNGTDGVGISKLTKRYGVSDSATIKPTRWTNDMPDAKKGQYIWCEVTITYTTGAAPDVYYTISYIGTDGRDGTDGIDGVSPNTSFKSTVFTRQNTQPDIPSGGTFDNPVPDGTIWTDGIPDGEEKLWASTRIFSSDGKSPQQSSWTEPKQMTDMADFDVEFSSLENPIIPVGHPNTNTQWSNVSDSSTIWMATSVKRNGEWTGWVMSRIKGERGEDGTSIKIKGTLNSTSELPSVPADESDCYIIGYDLYVWDGDSWINAGPFKGQDGTSMYIHIKYANSTTLNDWTANNGETPGKYIGIYVDSKAADSMVWGDYNWSKWEGEDGFGYEYIYKRTATSEAPSTPTATSQENDFVPTGWTNDPTGVSQTYPYEWLCYRKKTEGRWGAFKGSKSDNTKAALWAKYGLDGRDGSEGTSVRIKGTLNSKEELPTSGVEYGDSYIIGEDLWQYNGNSIVSDKIYNGFVNVGKIVGDNGKVPCVHIAWCNGNPAKGDYTGFDVDAPDGSLFDYMGIYVDYKDNIDDVCPDPTDPSVYTWTKICGKDGDSAIQVDLTCESDEIALTHEGAVAFDQTVQTYVGMFEGRESIQLTDISYKAPTGIKATVALTGGPSNYPGIITIKATSGSTVFSEGSNRIELTITGKCLDGTKTYQVRIDYVVIGVKAGQPGEDAIIYELDVTPDVVKKYKDGTFDSSTVSCCLYKIKGETREVSEDGRLAYSIDGKTEVSTINNYGVSVNNITNRIEFMFYLDGASPRLKRKVLIVADGREGEAPTIVKTSYKYAVSMSFTKTPNDLTAWTDEPIDVEPGQYLYTMTIREWSNGDTTYDFSWVRGGLNGYSNLPYVSTVFKRSATEPSKPSGGDYYNPVPSSDWSDGVPSGSVKLWMSWRKFTADGLEPQDTEWNDVVSALGTTTLNVKYNSNDECPKNPDVAPSGTWSSIPSESSVWGAFQKIVDGVPYNWELRRIKGEGCPIDMTSAATPFMGEWDSSTPYYGTKTRTDIVRVTGQSGSSEPGTYYYIANKAKNFDGVITPQPGTTAGDAYWLRFGANFDNIATGFLFSEKIGADIITAINATVDKIDAKNINVDNIVASKVKTADTGTRILIEDNKLTAYDNDNQYLFRLDPGFNVDNNYTMEASYNTYKLPSSITIGTVSGATTKRTVRKIIVNSFSVLSGTHGYVSNVGVRNLKYKVISSYLEYGDVITADIYLTLDGDIFAKKSIEIRDDVCDYIYPDSAISIPIDPIESEYMIEAFADIRITLGSSTTSRIQPPMIKISVEEDTEIVSFYTYGLIVGNNGLRSGSIPLNKKVLIDATSDNIFSAETERFGLKINNGLFVKTPSTGVYDMLRNPIVIDVQKDLPDDCVTNEIMLRMRNAILDGIPVFFKSLVSYNFGDGNETITVMWNINEMYSTGQSFSSGELSFYSSVRLRSLKGSNPSINNPDYFIANLFIKGLITRVSVGDTPFDGVGDIIVNIERMYNTNYSRNVSDLTSRVVKLEERVKGLNNS